MTILCKAELARGREWQAALAESVPEVPCRLWPETGDPRDIHYLITWEPSHDLIETLPHLQVVFCAGAGIDQFDLSRIPPSIPLVRMIEPGITEDMVEYVVAATLILHRRFLDYIAFQRAARWQIIRTKAAAQCRIGIMGLGKLGQAAIARLKAFAFPLHGWSRSPHVLDGVACFAGDEQLDMFLHHCDILICLLPLTAATRGILCKRAFDAMPAGAALINVGRGGHLCENDLLDALDSGRLSAAVLDVMAQEPPSADHPFWKHPRILMTPHIASITNPQSAAQAVADNIRRHRAGQPMHGQVDRRLGY
ncbi:MAG: glyoxylate/hydroxypyruvate reductase A [Alphaproteobacteria bacterium]|nr:MAG: glyoxylate/hydroxypyruvate reductase A [Alphaproteobacteria bacterium]